MYMMLILYQNLSNPFEEMFKNMLELQVVLSSYMIVTKIS
jgi:hypothetical protein